MLFYFYKRQKFYTGIFLFVRAADQSQIHLMLSQILQDLLDPRKKSPSRLCQFCAKMILRKKRKTQFPFQGSHVLSNSGLSTSRFFNGTCIASRFNDRNKQFHLFQIHAVLRSRNSIL